MMRWRLEKKDERMGRQRKRRKRGKGLRRKKETVKEGGGADFLAG